MFLLIYNKIIGSEIDMTDADYYVQLGKKLRSYRKNKQITLNELSEKLHKGISTLSKYESGEIAISIRTLFDLCEILNVDLITLLPENINRGNYHPNDRFSKYFENLLYVYWYNGVENSFHTGVMEINNTLEHTVFYFDINDPENYYDCGYIYNGNVQYSDSGIVFSLKNNEPPFDSIHIRIPFLIKRGTPRAGIMSCITTYYQNAAVKIVTSQKPLTMNEELKDSLMISQEDIKEMKHSNFFIVP